PVATTLLGGPVLPTRAKGVLYGGDTPWHADSAFAVASVGFAAYLEPLRAETGALRVLPGSHRGDFTEALPAPGAARVPARARPPRGGFSGGRSARWEGRASPPRRCPRTPSSPSRAT